MNEAHQQAREGLDAFARPHVARHAEMPKLAEGGEDWSAEGEVYAGIHSTYCSVGIVELPPNHEGSPAARSTEHILLNLAGRLTLTVDGRFEHELEKQDTVFIPAFIDYAVSNPAAEPASYVCINLFKSEWPGRLFVDGGAARMPFRTGPKG